MCIQADHIYFQIWKAPETAHLRYLKISEKVNQLSKLKKKSRKKNQKILCSFYELCIAEFLSRSSQVSKSS